jgi:menaquinone-dependent protoporphyrinogen oxidase
MGAEMTRVLVVYGTTTGTTAGVAERIGAVLRARGVTVDVVAAKDAPDPSGYDAVFVGSGVRASNWHAPVKEWVARYAAELKGMKVAFFSVGLTLASDAGKTAEMRAYTDPLVAETGVGPVDVGVFAGANEPAKFSFVERTIMKLMKAPTGDFRDWDAIEAWAGSTADAMGVVA